LNRDKEIAELSRIFANASANWKPEPVKEEPDRIAEILAKAQKKINDNFSDMDKMKAVNAFFTVQNFSDLSEEKKKTVSSLFETVPQRVITDMRIPSQSIIIMGKTLIGKTLILDTLYNVLKEKRKLNLREQNRIAGTLMDDDDRLRINRELDRFERSSRMYYVSESEITNYAAKFDSEDFDEVLHRMKESNLILIDELFYASNWNFSGDSGERVKGRFKQMWDKIRDMNRDDKKIFIGTTNNDFMQDSIIPVSVIKSRIAETFEVQIVLEGKK
jgi:DNA replication protein DnaC